MKNILSTFGKRKLSFLAKQKSIYCFDFDGTLVPIVNDPNAVIFTEATKNLLLNLQKKRKIAIITGRSKAALKSILNFEPDFVIGNHGIEGISAQQSFLDECRAITKSWIEKLSHLLEVESLSVDIEDKEFSICINYRKLENNVESLNKLNLLILKIAPLPHVIHGKFVLNLMPHSSVDKGTALVDLMNTYGFEYAFYAGDDITDEDVFKLKLKNIITVHIGQNKKSNAEYFLKEQSDMDTLLSEINNSIP